MKPSPQDFEHSDHSDQSPNSGHARSPHACSSIVPSVEIRDWTPLPPHGTEHSDHAENSARKIIKKSFFLLAALLTNAV